MERVPFSVSVTTNDFLFKFSQNEMSLHFCVVAGCISEIEYNIN